MRTTEGERQEFHTESNVNIEGKEEHKLEISVPESDTTNLTIIGKSDIIFSVLYGFLFLWGLALTLLSI